MSYLPITILAHLLNGFSLLIDKSLVDHSLKSPFVYTFYIGVLSLLAILLIPFGFHTPTLAAVVFASLSGVIFTLGVVTFFTILRTLNVTLVAPLIGTLNPIFSLIIGLLFLNQTLSPNQYLAFAFFTLGGILLTYHLWWGKHHLDKRFLIMVASGFLFGLSYVLLKEAFDLSNYITGLVISRISMGVLVSCFLFFPTVRSQIFSPGLTRHFFVNKIGVLVLSSQLAGAISGLMLTFAVSLTSPAIVNSMYGVQYILLLVVTFILSAKNPSLLDERLSLKQIPAKIIATIVMVLGLYLLAR